MVKLLRVTNELFLVIITCQWCSSDFNVIIPEICSWPESLRLNMSWIRDTVHAGIQEDQSQVSLNIFGPDEICDGSEGLLKVLSVAHSDPTAQMITSLPEHLCPTAQTFFHLRQRHFTSWTCARSPGVFSLKPTGNDVIVGVQRLVKHFNWRRVGFTRSRADSSPFCEEMGAQLQQFYDAHSHENASIVLLGSYEDTTHLRTLASSNLDSLLLCTSYSYVLKHYMFLNSSNVALGSETFLDKLRPIPNVLISEWPIPTNVFTPKGSSPTYALVTIPTTSSSIPPFEIDLFKWSHNSLDKNVDQNYNVRLQKLMEMLLANLILRSVRVRLELDRSQWESSSWSPTGGGTHFNKYAHHHSIPNSKLSVYYSVVQFEKGRWHPLINLSSSNGNRETTRTTVRMKEQTLTITHHHKNNDLSSEDDWVTWVQVLIITSASAAVILSLICISLFVRKRSRDSMYGSTTRRKLSRRLRSQGPYKVLLTSKDIAFGTIAPATTTEPNLKKSNRSQFVSTGQTHGGGGSEERPDLLKGSHGALRKNTTRTGTGPNIKVETNLTGEHRGARYKGDLVHLKEIPSFSEPLQVKMKALTVLETLHGLRHENLAAMLGCLTEVSPGLVWEFCSRGSLYDILQQSDIKLDWAFKLSLLTDLVRGMRYLHLSMVRVHGCLNSFNCVVDARWILKITNYGMNSLMQAQGLPPLDMSITELLWVAPELLRDETLRKHGSQAGDVYSFAIIMQEVLVRGKPYSMLTLSAQEILEKVKRPPPLIRPSVSKGAAPPEAINIMRQCWAEQPDMRPDFMVIHDLFKTLNHGRKANIVDTMFQMLEKYSNNLEELIRERTDQLDLERKKTEQLLNRMLPSTVAEKLKMGLPVDPEEFSEVTIYFSDIVGFTTIAAYSTPVEVVNLLNDLYSSFDSVIQDYSVYKVETIGDAYMVVGGAPLWSLDHADQIATMSLDLLHESGKFRIRHLPFTPLRLRIGIHTGPCCAGVVGLTMPRYCLFGDTVNTASRMESTGAAWRIHISRETKAKLDSIGGYVIQYRGMTDIKGKGQLETFWLLGKEGFDKELPKPPGLHESVRLDEKSIQFGRTGKLPSTENIKGNEFGENNSGISAPNQQHPSPSPNATLPSKIQPKYCVLTGENLRCLSPAEQVAYQLLNGKPITRGLRRQFSLDQGANSHPLVSMKSFRKAPSLEDNNTCEQHQSNSPPTAAKDFCQDQPPPPSPKIQDISSTQPQPTADSQLNSCDNSSTGRSGQITSTTTTAATARIFTTATNPSLPVLEESPLAARRGRNKLASISMDT